MKIINICNRIIEYSFYALFFLVPLIIAGKTSELFEFNKMWLTFGLTIVIGATWIAKSIVKRQFRIQRTPLDIPIFLFLLSQIISTVFSWDVHVSIWGYYSRFNGGLLSIISYIFLYYAFVSNFISEEDKRGVTSKKDPHRVPAVASDAARTSDGDKARQDPKRIVKRLIFVSLASGLIVSLWGLPSHFGYDPTCFLFRGSFDVSCWTADFQPKIRIFSTLGQPDWLAAYLAILLPIPISLALANHKSQAPKPKQVQNSNKQNQKRFGNLNLKNLNLFGTWNLRFGIYLIFAILFYIDLLYTRSRSGILASWISLVLLLAIIFWIKKKEASQILTIIILIFSFLIITFLIGQPFIDLNKLIPAPAPKSATLNKSASQPTYAGELGGTDSGKIRLLVWQGAIRAWKDYPLFGTGVETFAFAYYKYKSPAHNLTSEWNFLYNKAHNEYLNYLATTGAFGLGTYLLIIGWFLFIAFKNHKSEITNPKQIQNSNKQNQKRFGNLNLKNLNLFGTWNLKIEVLSLSLIVSYLSILISNFFGFSVVIVNIYLFMIPAFVFALEGMIDSKKYFSMPKASNANTELSPFQWVGVSLIVLIGLYLIYTLFTFWTADKSYAYGSNLDRAGYYQQAYPYLHKAVAQRGDEPVFKDELSINDAILATELLTQKDTKSASEAAATASNLAQEAIATSNEVVGSSSNNVVFWKTRVRIFYALSQADQRFLPMALTAIRRTAELAPNDASILYNLGVLEGQNGNLNEAIKALEKTVKIKPDFRDPYFALGLFYHQKSIDKNGRVVDKKLLEKAVAQMQYILTNISSKDAQAQDALKSWGKTH